MYDWFQKLLTSSWLLWDIHTEIFACPTLKLAREFSQIKNRNSLKILKSFKLSFSDFLLHFSFNDQNFVPKFKDSQSFSFNISQYATFNFQGPAILKQNKKKPFSEISWKNSNLWSFCHFFSCFYILLTATGYIFRKCFVCGFKMMCMKNFYLHSHFAGT